MIFSHVVNLSYILLRNVVFFSRCLHTFICWPVDHVQCHVMGVLVYVIDLKDENTSSLAYLTRFLVMFQHQSSRSSHRSFMIDQYQHHAWSSAWFDVRYKILVAWSSIIYPWVTYSQGMFSFAIGYELQYMSMVTKNCFYFMTAISKNEYLDND